MDEWMDEWMNITGLISSFHLSIQDPLGTRHHADILQAPFHLILPTTPSYSVLVYAHIMGGKTEAQGIGTFTKGHTVTLPGSRTLPAHLHLMPLTLLWS